MAFQVGSACYGSDVESAQAQASTQAGAVVTHGSAAYVVSVQTVTGTSITYALNPIAGGTALTVAAPYNAQPCNLMQLADGLQLGWMVAGAWIGTYCVLFLGRALKGENTDGDA